MTRPNSARRESLKNQGRNNLVAGACNRIRLRIRNKSLSKAGRITDALFALQFVTSFRAFGECPLATPFRSAQSRSLVH
jgi:hypothetical protein